MRALPLLFSLLILVATTAAAEIIPWDDERWLLEQATLGEHLGRDALMGNALLKGVVFGNGIIEVDVAVTGARSGPGILFRRQSEGNYERFLLRPHRAGLYPDALQYTPVFNGVAGWQLYYGDGFTAGGTLPENEWIHLRIAVAGSQARVFVGNEPLPALVITDLVRGDGRGGLGLLAPADGSAYFSRFSYRADESLELGTREQPEAPPGTLMEWRISETIKTSSIKKEVYPAFFKLFGADWEAVRADSRGLVDVARHRERGKSGADLVMARSFVYSPTDQRRRLAFGYSDDVYVFLNGKPVFAGGSGYGTRDPSFLGIVGLSDMLFMDLKRGVNEIFLMVSESSGGWGFTARFDKILDTVPVDHARLRKVWETERVFLTPESVLYDPASELLYVSSYHLRHKRGDVDPSKYSGFISRLGLDGEVIDLRWADKLRAPCGMAITQGRLWAVERRSLAEIDIETGKLIARYPIPQADFPNDIVAAEDGSLFLTDTSSSRRVDSRILRFADGEFEMWLQSEEISAANGLLLDGGRLLVGNSGDACLKAVDLATRAVSRVACLGTGVIDGIRIDREGNYLVSRWEGQIFSIAPDGEVTEILDLLPGKMNAGDFEFVAERDLLVVPTFTGDRVVAYELVR